MIRLRYGQEYRLVEARPYVRREGSLTALLILASTCAQCGEPFTTSTPKGSGRFEPNRRCQRHTHRGHRLNAALFYAGCDPAGYPRGRSRKKNAPAPAATDERAGAIHRDANGRRAHTRTAEGAQLPLSRTPPRSPSRIGRRASRSSSVEAQS